MKVYQIFQITRNALNAVASEGVSLNIFQHIEMFEEYKRMVNAGHKKMYIEIILCEKYKIKRARFYNIVRDLSKDISAKTLNENNRPDNLPKKQ